MQRRRYNHSNDNVAGDRYHDGGNHRHHNSDNYEHDDSATF